MQRQPKSIATDFYEKVYWNNHKSVAGIDEAGRGALAGPVAAAAVIIPPKVLSDYGINDSKKISANKRKQFFEFITLNCLTYAFSFIDNEIIDEINVLQATIRAMKESVLKLKIKPDHLLIDGNYFRSFGIPFTTIVHGDEKSLSIASASIIAKVSRDRWMTEVADIEYPDYGFAVHKGYGTPGHLAAIRQYGLTPIHRKTFLEKYTLPSLF